MTYSLFTVRGINARIGITTFLHTEAMIVTDLRALTIIFALTLSMCNNLLADPTGALVIVVARIV